MFMNSRAGLVAAPSAVDPRPFHRQLARYAPTPLHELPLLAAHLGVGRVFVKDESARLGLPSFKILGASWAIYRVLCRTLGQEALAWTTIDELAALIAPLQPLSFAAATDGNHGRAVAHMAHLLSCGAHIFVPLGTASSRIQALRDEGAVVVVVDGSYDEAVACAAAMASARCLVICDTGWPGYEEVPQWVIEGYRTIFSEIDDVLAAHQHGQPDVIAVQIGVGALAAAVVQHYSRNPLQSAPFIIGVEPISAACVYESLVVNKIVSLPGRQHSLMAGLNCGTPSSVAWPWLAGGLDAVVIAEDEHARQAMRLLAKAGLVAGETGAAGLAGLLAVPGTPCESALRQDLRLTQLSSVLLLMTEGASDPESYRRIVGPLS